MAETSIGGPAGALPETLWTEVIAVRTADPARAREALSALIARYWKPVYFFIRRRGASVEDAKGPHPGLLRRSPGPPGRGRADPALGRFRNWLLACLRNFLADASDKARAAKRGGGAAALSLEGAESEYLRDLPADAPGPEEAYHRKWAATSCGRRSRRSMKSGGSSCGPGRRATRPIRAASSRPGPPSARRSWPGSGRPSAAPPRRRRNFRP